MYKNQLLRRYAWEFFKDQIAECDQPGLSLLAVFPPPQCLRDIA
jgi:hypothetical protein